MPTPTRLPLGQSIGFDGSHYFDRNVRAGLIPAEECRALWAHHTAQYARETACGGACAQLHHDLACEYAEGSRSTP